MGNRTLSVLAVVDVANCLVGAFTFLRITQSEDAWLLTLELRSDIINQCYQLTCLILQCCNLLSAFGFQFEL